MPPPADWFERLYAQFGCPAAALQKPPEVAFYAIFNVMCAVREAMAAKAHVVVCAPDCLVHGDVYSPQYFSRRWDGAPADARAYAARMQAFEDALRAMDFAVECTDTSWQVTW